jgi:hypothetical protein
MKKTLFWILGVLAVLFVLGFAFGGWGWWHGGCCSWGGYGRYGGWGIGPGMMGGGFAPFGWIGMLFMALIPLGFLALTVLGIVWLVRAVSGNLPAPGASRTCPNCGKAVQADWQNCPYCGAALK